MDFVLVFPEQLGLHLKSLRKAAGLRQAELAALLGVSQSRVAAIEKDPTSVSVGQFLSILKLLNAELVIRQKNSVRSPIPPQQQALGMSATDVAKQGLTAFIAQEHAKQQALGMNAADVAKQGLTAFTAQEHAKQQALGMNAADVAKQGLTAFIAQEHSKQQALGMSTADVAKRYGLTAPTVTLKPQVLPTDWLNKKPKGSW